MRFDNRVTQLLGIDIPIFSAPMGYVAKPDLVAAVSRAPASSRAIDAILLGWGLMGTRLPVRGGGQVRHMFGSGKACAAGPPDGRVATSVPS